MADKIIQLKDINGNNLYPMVGSDINYIAQTSSQPLTVSHGGTGAKTPKAAIDNLNIFDYVYPIGSIYISMSATNPSILFGGNWERIGVGRTLVSAGGDENAVVDVNNYTGRGTNTATTTAFPVGETGGEFDNTLTPEQMPSHRHSVSVPATTSTKYGTNSGGQAPKATSTSYNTSYVGGGKSHNNMSTYLAVYMWKRTA